jgi:DNA modification methylase
MRQAKKKSSVRYSTVQTAEGALLNEPSVNGNGKRPENLENVIIKGDASSELKLFPGEHVDLIFTSPPYADSRKKTYGGIHPDSYVEWFVPFTAEFLRVLKPTGSFVLNIKEKVVGGERHTYVLDLIVQMRKQGWLWTEEYIWHKKNCYPGKWPNRFRDSWERCLHFTKSRHFAMYQEAVMVPMGDWKHARLRNLSETDQRRDESKVSSGFGKKIKNWVGRHLAYPTNVLHLATECGNKSHSAAFPEALPAWFIKLFTKTDDIVLDPFLGSGTTALAAAKLQRKFIGIEIKPDYCELARTALLEAGPIQAEFALSKNGHQKS